MKKALHDIPGEVILADLTLGGGTKFEDLVQAANEGDELASGIVARLFRYGASDAFLSELESAVRAIRFESHPRLDKAAGRFYWQRSFPLNQDVTHEAVYSMIAVLAVNSGEAQKVKRCDGKLRVGGKTTTCGNYYVGADNKLFCSTSCATRARVQAKRRRDRQSGVL